MIQMQQNSNFYQWQVGDIMDAPNTNYPNRKFKLLKVLGKGGEGMVFKAESINWNQVQICALKIHFIQQKELYIQFLGNLKQYQHQFEQPTQPETQKSNIIKIYDYFNNFHKQFVVVMELGTQDLFTYYQMKQNQSYEETCKFCIQIARSVNFLHYNYYIHRDLKPENFMMVENQIKMIDFGSIKNTDDRAKTRNIGTLAFQAPEIFNGNEKYTQAIDIWSLGCVFYEIIKREPLFEQQQYQQLNQLHQQPNKLQQYVQDKINQLFVCDEWKNVILKMFSINPIDRPNIQSILEILEKNNILHKTIQNIFSQINALMFDFLNQDIINHFKQNNQSKLELENQIKEAKKIFVQLFPDDQNSNQQINYNCQNIQEKMDLTDKLLQEIKQNQLKQQINLIDQISKLHGQNEANKLELQSIAKYEEEILKLNQEIQKSQNKIQEKNQIKIQFEELQQQKLAQSHQLKTIQSSLDRFKQDLMEDKQVIDENNTNQLKKYFDFQNLQIEKQKIQIQSLKEELLKMNIQEETFHENEKTITKLQKELDQNNITETRIYEQTLQISELQFQITMLNNLQQENINQQNQIKELEQQIQELQSQRKISIEQDFQINQLKSQLSYLRKKMETYGNIEEILQKAKKDLENVQQQKQEQFQKQQEIRNVLDQKEKEKIELNNSLHINQLNQETLDNLVKEIEIQKQEIHKLVQQNNYQMSEKIKQRNDLKDIIEDLKLQQKNQQQHFCLKTEGDKPNFLQNNNQFMNVSPFSMNNSSIPNIRQDQFQPSSPFQGYHFQKK